MYPYKRLLRCVLISLLLPLFPSSILAEENVADASVALVDLYPTDFEQDLSVEDTPEQRERILKGGFAGYRFLNTDGYGGRAAEFEYLHSSPTFGAHYNRLSRDLKYSVDGSYQNEKDFYGDLLFDYRGDYRLHVRMDSMFHNLDREELFPSAFTLPPATYSPHPDAPINYGMRIEQDLAVFRYKIHDFPLHVNLGYWRLFRSGTRQLIFADQAFEGGINNINAIPRAINGKTLEGSAGFDAHLGPVDLIYSFKLRQFHNNAGIPVYDFVARPDLSGTTLMRTAGSQEHNEDPASRFYSHTIKMHTSLAGGIVGAASYSFGKRDNRSRLADIGGAGSSSSDLHNVATDFMYTPCKEFSLALKYRLQDVDNDNATTIMSRFDIPGTIVTRPSIDVKTSVVTATMSVRPLNSLSLIGEYKGSFIQRKDLAGTTSETSWRNLPPNTNTNKGTFSIITRPVKGLRLKALYSYSATDSPSYGTTFSDRHEGKFLATYNSSNRWGMTANYMAAVEKNEAISRNLLDFSVFPTIRYVSYGLPLGREKKNSNISASVWVTPVTAFTVTASYAFLKSSVDQGVLLTSSSDSVHTAANFSSESHIYSLDSLYRWDEKWDVGVLLQQIRSSSQFVPVFLSVSSGGSIVGDTEGISEYSRTRTVENTVSARSEYRFSDNISGTLEYAFREYRDKVASSFTGSVQTYMVLLNAKW